MLDGPSSQIVNLKVCDPLEACDTDTITIGIILEIFLTGDFYLLISRVIIIIGLILLYIGLTLPKRIKVLFLKS